MKKLLATVLCLCLFAFSASAESLDFATMTDDELTAIIEAAQNELNQRHPQDNNTLENFVLIDENGVKCYLTGEYEIVGSYDDGYCDLMLGAVIENNSGETVNVNVDDCTVNGFKVFGVGANDTRPGQKQRTSIDLYLADAGIYSIDEIESISISFNMAGEDYFVFWTGDVIELPHIG